MENNLANKIEEDVKEVNKLSVKYQCRDKKNRLKFLTRVSMFTALSYVFYITLKFPLALLFPEFLEINISGLFIIIGALSTGPVGGAIICIARFLLKLPLSHTLWIGEFSDLLLSLIYILPMSIYYMKHHDKKGGYIAILIAFISWVVGSILSNLAVLPMYIGITLNGDKQALINMLGNSNINENNFVLVYILGIIFPFNLIIGFINCGTAFLVYKKISVLLKKMGI